MKLVQKYHTVATLRLLLDKAVKLRNQYRFALQNNLENDLIKDTNDYEAINLLVKSLESAMVYHNGQGYKVDRSLNLNDRLESFIEVLSDKRLDANTSMLSFSGMEALLARMEKLIQQVIDFPVSVKPRIQLEEVVRTLELEFYDKEPPEPASLEELMERCSKLRSNIKWILPS